MCSNKIQDVTFYGPNFYNTRKIKEKSYFWESPNKTIPKSCLCDTIKLSCDYYVSHRYDTSFHLKQYLQEILAYFETLKYHIFL